MTLNHLFEGIPSVKFRGSSDTNVTGVSMDSRNVVPGDLFVAIRGEKSDGRTFVKDAISKGATAIAAETEFDSEIPFVQFSAARQRLGLLSSRIYGEPSNHLTVVGVTGTNGKTTVCFLVESIFQAAGKKSGILGTVTYRWNGKDQGAPRTTPEAPDLQRMLRDMWKGGVEAVVMECSSHGLELGRLSALDLDVAVFTNLTPEHLDFHSSLEAYAASKRKLFDEVLTQSRKVRRVGVLNVDDATGARWKKELSLPLITFSVKGAPADITVSEHDLRPDGIRATFSVQGKSIQINSKLVGIHNLANIATALAAGVALGLSLNTIASGIEKLPGVPGRLERVQNSRGVHVFVDYAHTDDALANVLKALEPLRTKRLITVFGCGGDRDRTKRPRMARVAASSSDIAILTSDNPRTESPEAILDEIEKGLPAGVARVSVQEANTANGKFAVREVDRRKAIQLALEIAKAGDIVLIAGKGHETYQEINGVQSPFDDREVAVA